MRRTTRGEGQVKLIITLALVGATFFVGYKFIPVKMQHSALQDRIIEECKMAGADPRRTAEVIRDNVWETAVEQGLEAYFEKRDIKVTRTSNQVTVKLYYERDVVLPGYTYTWKFDLQEKRSIY